MVTCAFRPQYVVFPKDKKGFDIDDQYYIGSNLLVKPITEAGVTETSVYLAEDQAYYDYFTHRIYCGAATGKSVSVPAALHQVPLLVRGGSILPTRERPRRASSMMKYDPFTLRVALDKNGQARGELYLDDGVSYNYQRGEFIWREFAAEQPSKKENNGAAMKISNRNLASANLAESTLGISVSRYDSGNAYAKDVAEVRVEKVVVLGLGKMPVSVRVEETGNVLAWEYVPGVAAGEWGKEGVASLLTIKDPKVLVGKEWTIGVYENIF